MPCERVILEVVFAKAAELGGVVMLAWIALSLLEDTKPGPGQQPEFISITKIAIFGRAHAPASVECLSADMHEVSRFGSPRPDPEDFPARPVTLRFPPQRRGSPDDRSALPLGVGVAN